MFVPTLLDRLDLSNLFPYPDMFDSSGSWQRAGFDVDIGREGDKSDIMVATHPLAPGVLFKKYSKKVSLKNQLENYTRRVKGAQKLRELIDGDRLTKIAVPSKHLYELSSSKFSRKGRNDYILVVERFVLVDKVTCQQMYGNMDDETLRQLCVVVSKIRGLSAGLRNMPFAHDGRIAFIDTERWGDGHKGPPLQNIRDYLTDAHKRFVDDRLVREMCE